MSIGLAMAHDGFRGGPKTSFELALRIRPEITSGFQANSGQAHRGCCLTGLGASPGCFLSRRNRANALRLDSIAETVAIALLLKTGSYFLPDHL